MNVSITPKMAFPPPLKNRVTTRCYKTYIMGGLYADTSDFVLLNLLWTFDTRRWYRRSSASLSTDCRSVDSLGLGIYGLQA
uniref:Uncharacterized protein n=1 Tax=Babesia bovis TaxID=5865 RepID=S6AZ45_BABBO|nr:hypothetical protein [Babesia bovis]